MSSKSQKFKKVNRGIGIKEVDEEADKEIKCGTVGEEAIW